MHNVKIIIFGAGKCGRRLGRCLNDLEITYHYYTDNNDKIWGEEINGKEVIAPTQLTEIDCKIVVAIQEWENVYRKLIDMGLRERLISIDEMYLKVCDIIKEKYQIGGVQYKVCQSNTIYTDNFFTEIWGGMEKWIYVVASQLLKRKRSLRVLTNKEHSIFLKDLESNLHITKHSREKWWNSIPELLEEILSHMPCTILCNTIDVIYYVASCAKHLYPENIKIVMVRHNNRDYLNKQLYDNIHNIDVVMGVSKDICKTLCSVNKIPEYKLVYKESFVESKDNLIRMYSNGDMPLQICVVGRIEKLHKRMDLLIPIIQCLESQKCNYTVNIAGIGSYEETLKEFVHCNNLTKKIIFMGFLYGDKLESFYSTQDVYIHCSDYEGAPLAMIEAMAYGAVPIVTNVGIACEVIKHGVNGYICNVGDVENICKSVVKLANHREQLPIIGQKCREIVKEKCNLNDYIDYIECISDGDNLKQYQNW